MKIKKNYSTPRLTKLGSLKSLVMGPSLGTGESGSNTTRRA